MEWAWSTQPSTQTPGFPSARHRFSVLLLCEIAGAWLNVLQGSLAQQGQGLQTLLGQEK